MRPFWIGAVLIALVTACAHARPPTQAASPTSSGRATAVHPAQIKRVVRELPPNYEITTGIPSGASPRVIWSLKADATTKPAQCAALADPGNGRDQAAQGVSASGAGGIVDSIVVALPGPLDLDPNLVGGCGHWTMTAGHTTTSVHLTDAPHIDGADTLGMIVDIKSSVESGTQIDSRAYTFVAYLGEYYAFTTLITDPGSALPALPARFAADLLVKTVATLRS